MRWSEGRIALLGAALSGLLLAGCFGGPPPGPAWRIQAAEASERYYAAMLVGDSQRATSNLRRALEAASRSDDLRSLARVHLGRAAMQVALRREPSFARTDDLLGLTDDPALAAYRRFLSGELQAQDPGRLPEALASPARALLRDRPGALAKAVAGIEAPRRRLVAAAVAHRRYPNHRAFADTAVAAASAEGWRGVLLTWLPVQASAAEAAGNGGEAAAIRDRLRWLRDPLAGQPEANGGQAAE